MVAGRAARALSNGEERGTRSTGVTRRCNAGTRESIALPVRGPDRPDAALRGGTSMAGNAAKNYRGCLRVSTAATSSAEAS
jgi:hypothetical protein